ncbi:hypothetical protein BX616_010650 [Lobosporangium transversale]|nr:hypothetical protein BX616_010650 [Lobosporangium transversale]
MLSSKDPMVPQTQQKSTAAAATIGGSGAIEGSGVAAGTGTGAAAAVQDTTNPHVNAHPFFWSGPTFSTGYLEPLAEIDIVFVASFTKYGVYDINRWRLAVQVVKAQRKIKRKNGFKSSNNNKKQVALKSVEEEQDEEERQAMLPPETPQSVGKGFMQMPNLAHYIQIS